ncbi:MAG: HAD-IIIA family hydrolase [Lachnospiraceae bacterium]|nr:HAD-IIIA family hydrolase [Lachnospiraceae bacterium]
MKKALIFDMDGTILDTLEDLKDSMNHVLKQYGFPERTTDEIRMFVGNGIRKLVERAAPCQTDSGLIEEMYCAMLSYYREHCQVKTKPYEGIPELLKELKVLGIRTAVVSNKADAAVQTLSKQYFDGLFDVSSGAKDGMKLKPDREMCDSVLSLLKVNAKDAFYVGDSEVDIETAKNAGMDCISVSWGFRSREALSSSGARLVADKPGDVLKYVMQG